MVHHLGKIVDRFVASNQLVLSSVYWLWYPNDYTKGGSSVDRQHHFKSQLGSSQPGFRMIMDGSLSFQGGTLVLYDVAHTQTVPSPPFA